MTKPNAESQDIANEKELTDALNAAIEKEGSTEPTDAAVDYIALQNEIETLKNQLKEEELRSVANTQNLTRRHREELQAAHKFAAQQFATDMVLIKDFLEMALKDESGNIEAIKMGVDMTLKQLISAFEKNHISEINPLGEMLDPNKHQAMNTEVSEQPVNTITQVMQKGYEMHGRILRPAMVVVAAAPEQS